VPKLKRVLAINQTIRSSLAIALQLKSNLCSFNMNQVVSISLIAMLFTSLGCGKSEGGNSDTVIACDHRQASNSQAGTCSDWDGEKQADHKAVGMCNEGAIELKNACPTEGRVGTCNVRHEEKRYYSPTYTAESAKTNCSNDDGVWKP